MIGRQSFERRPLLTAVMNELPLVFTNQAAGRRLGNRVKLRSALHADKVFHLGPRYPVRPICESCSRFAARHAIVKELIFSLAPDDIANKTNLMKNYTKILFSILAAVICTATFAADKPTCKKTGKNCPMNDNKECNCGKSCDC